MLHNVKQGSNITIVSGSRFRKISEDGKTLLDQKLHEGALLDSDTTAKVLHVIAAKKSEATAYVVEIEFKGQRLYGWIYEYEIIPSAQSF